MASTTTHAPTTDPFVVGSCYQARSACDSSCVWTFRVVARTAGFVVLEDVDTGETMRVKARRYGDGSEWALPFGSFSMAPSIRSTRPSVEAYR